MERSPDLIRDILLVIEQAPAGTKLNGAELTFEGFSPVEVSEHLCLLEEAGLIKAVISRSLGAASPRLVIIDRLTWEGHDFLDSVRSPAVWKKTRAAVLDKGGAFTFELLKEVALHFAREHLNLG